MASWGRTGLASAKSHGVLNNFIDLGFQGLHLGFIQQSELFHVVLHADDGALVAPLLFLGLLAIDHGVGH